MFERVNEERYLIKTIKQPHRNWIGHVLRGDGLLRDVTEGRVKGKKRAGKPRKGMIKKDCLIEAFSKTRTRKVIQRKVRIRGEKGVMGVWT